MKVQLEILGNYFNDWINIEINSDIGIYLRDWSQLYVHKKFIIHRLSINIHNMFTFKAGHTPTWYDKWVMRYAMRYNIRISTSHKIIFLYCDLKLISIFLEKLWNTETHIFSHFSIVQLLYYVLKYGLDI